LRRTLALAGRMIASRTVLDRCHLLRRSLWPVAGDVSVQFRLMLRDIVLPPSSSDNGTTVPVPPKGILTGRVTSTNGLPLRDVSIDPVGVEGIHGNTRTNKDGWYRVSLFPGTYRVMAGSPTQCSAIDVVDSRLHGT
jgi:hypothetical protein